MRKIPAQYRNLPSAKRLEEAKSKFDEAAGALVTANRAARAAGKRFTAEMQEQADRLSIAQQRLKEAEADFDSATGGPEPVAFTPLVMKKVQQLFPPDQQSEAIGLLEKECGRNLPLCEGDSSQDLERVRLAVIKLAGGSLAELQRQINIASVDWRDVLNSAEYPEASVMGFVEYNNLDELSRNEIKARDRQQYVAWLGEEDITLLDP
jgi:hypothetical protein